MPIRVLCGLSQQDLVSYRILGRSSSSAMLCRGECIVVQQLYLCPGAIQLAYVTLPITVPSIGTSIEVLRLTRDRLQCHVSGESNPLQVLSPLEKTAGH